MHIFDVSHLLFYLNYSLLSIYLIHEYILLALYFQIFNSGGLKTILFGKYVSENKINKQQN
jgi:hypothetical protein